uniref:Uncharacterized protein n=1 Tax=Rhizophora mucronata TaxID=61149 RepID=A0A2P2QTW3_RHIMU
MNCCGHTWTTLYLGHQEPSSASDSDQSHCHILPLCLPLMSSLLLTLFIHCHCHCHCCHLSPLTPLWQPYYHNHDYHYQCHSSNSPKGKGGNLKV